MINLISLVDCINFSYYNLKESGPVPREKLPCETIADNNRPAQECKSQILVSLRVFRTSRNNENAVGGITGDLTYNGGFT